MNATRIINNLFAMARRNRQLVTCQHEQRLGVSDDGTPQYGTPTPFDAMWLAERQRVRNADGEVVDVGGRLFVPRKYPMTELDRITLPDGTQPTIVTIDSSAVTSGATHYEVVF